MMEFNETSIPCTQMAELKTLSDVVSYNAVYLVNNNNCKRELVCKSEDLKKTRINSGRRNS